MNRYILLLVAICALSTLAFGQRSKILNIATAGYVEQSKPDQAVSSSATNALLCKGDGTINCGCYQVGKTRPYFRWDNMNTLFQPYDNVQLDYVFLSLSQSCSQGDGSLWNGAQMFYTTTYWSKSTITWNNQPNLTPFKNLTSYPQFEMDKTLLDSVLKSGASTFSVALDSGSMIQNAHFYGTADVTQATLGIYWSCKAGWTSDANGQCTIATPLPPITAPVSPPVTPPVTPPVAVPVAVPVSTPVTPPTTPPVTSSPVAAPTNPPVASPTTPPVASPTTPPVTPPTASPVSPPVDSPVAAPVFTIPEGVCGNDQLDVGEQCDGGGNCEACACSAGSVPTVPASLACTKCGNGQIDAAEQCDGGDFCVACHCAPGYEPESPASFSCHPIVPPTHARVVPMLECFKVTGDAVMAFVGWNNLENSTQTIPKGDLNFFNPVEPSGGDVTSFASCLHIGYPSSPIILTWSGHSSVTWKLSDFALVIDTTNEVAKCPTEVTLRISISVASNGSTTLSPQQLADLTLVFAQLLGVSPARLTLVIETNIATKRSTSTSMSFSLTVGGSSDDTQQTSFEAVSSFLSRVQNDDTLLKGAIEEAVPSFTVQQASVVPRPLASMQAGQTGVNVPRPTPVPSTTPADSAISSASIVVPLTVFAGLALCFL